MNGDSWPARRVSGWQLGQSRSLLEWLFVSVEPTTICQFLLIESPFFRKHFKMALAVSRVGSTLLRASCGHPAVHCYRQAVATPAVLTVILTVSIQQVPYVKKSVLSGVWSELCEEVLRDL